MIGRGFRPGGRRGAPPLSEACPCESNKRREDDPWSPECQASAGQTLSRLAGSPDGVQRAVTEAAPLLSLCSKERLRCLCFLSHSIRLDLTC